MATSRRPRALVSLLALVVAACTPPGDAGVGSSPLQSTTTVVGEATTAPLTPVPATTLPATTLPATTLPATTVPPATVPVTTEPPPPPLIPFSRLEELTTTSAYGPSGEELALWQETVPRIEDVRFVSTGDGSEQPALWLPPEAQRPAPLLVVVHSWSLGYLQHTGIPFAAWADANGWAMIAPDFRGANVGPESTGSDLAVQDVVDAIDFAVGQGDVDEERVFVIGYSGGGMMSLLVAGRHPDRFAGAVSWVPVYDLVDWYDYVRVNLPDRAYTDQIVASCGGDPSVPGEAQQSCRHRSPSTHLGEAARAGLPVYIGHGLSDGTVPPAYAVRAFDQLAEPPDRLGAEVADGLADDGLPDNLQGSVEAETYFEAGEPEVFLARASGPVTLVIFDGEHDMVYHPGLAWIHGIAAGP